MISNLGESNMYIMYVPFWHDDNERPLSMKKLGSESEWEWLSWGCVSHVNCRSRPKTGSWPALIASIPFGFEPPSPVSHSSPCDTNRNESTAGIFAIPTGVAACFAVVAGVIMVWSRWTC